MPRTADYNGETIVWDEQERVWKDSTGNPLFLPPGPNVGDARVPEPLTPEQASGVMPGESAGFLSNLAANVVDSPEVKIKHLAAGLGIPEERFRVLQDGQIVYEDEEGVTRTATGNSPVDTAADLASVTPELTGSLIGAAAGGPVGSALGAAAGVAAKNIFANTVLDDEQSAGGVAKEIGLEAALDAATGFVGAKLGKVATARAGKRVVPDVDKFNRQQTLATIDRIERVTGIKLDVAQASGLASLRALRKWAYKYPNQASAILEANREMQEGSSEAAVQRLLGALTEGIDNSRLATEAINAANGAIDFAVEQRRIGTAKLYRTAFDGSEAIDSSTLVDWIDNEIKASVGSRRAALRKMKRMLTVKGGKPQTNLETLHNVKVELDGMLSNDPQTSAASLAKGAVKKVRGELVSLMEEGSPGYKIAQEKFARLSERLVDPLKDGAIGALARIKGSKNVAMVSRWFAGEELLPFQMRAMRTIIERQPGGKDTWRGLMRVRIATALDKASKESQGGMTNIGPKLRAELYSTPNRRAAWDVALDGTNVDELFSVTMEAFQKIAQTGVGGSDTAFNLAVESGLRDAAPFSGIKEGIGNPLRGLANMIFDASEEEFVQQNAIAIAEAMVTPAKVARLAQLRKGGLTVRKAAEVLGIVTGLSAVEEITEESY